jgi:hypothetical protein
MPGLERVREHRPDLVLLPGRVHIDDSLDRLRGVDGVQGAEHEVAGLGGADGERRGLEVAHFAHEDDVRVLTQGVLEAAGERRHVLAEFALLDDALVALEGVLDGVLERDDVLAVALVHRLDHGGERGGLARAGVAGDEHQAARQVRQPRDDLGEVQGREGRHLGLDHSHRQAQAAALHVGVDAVAGEAVDLVREVRVLLAVEDLLRLLGRHLLEHGARRLRRDHREVHRRHDLVHADDRGLPRDHVHVGGVGVVRGLEDIVQLHAHLLRWRPLSGRCGRRRTPRPAGYRRSGPPR